MPRLLIFDFDQTITKNHTFIHQDEYNPDNNLKDDIRDYFIHNGTDTISAIATYHNNTDYVKTYIEKILNTELELMGEKLYQYHKNTRFSVPNCDTPLIISTIRDDNSYNNSIGELLLTGKNTQILSILYELKQPMRDTTFYDDSLRNIQHALQLPELGAIQISTEEKNTFSGVPVNETGITIFSETKCSLLSLQIQFESVLSMSTTNQSHFFNSIWRKDSYHFSKEEQKQIRDLKAELLDTIPSRLNGGGDYDDLLDGDKALSIIDFNVNNAAFNQKKTTGTRKEITQRYAENKASCNLLN